MSEKIDSKKSVASRRKFRTAYDGSALAVSQATAYRETGISQTKIAEQDDANINKMVDRALKTGVPLQQKFDGSFGVSEVNDYKEAMDLIASAQQDFEALPSKIRLRFGNRPEQLLEFLGDAKNRAEAEDLGLVSPQQTSSSSAPAGGAPTSVKGPKDPKESESS